MADTREFYGQHLTAIRIALQLVLISAFVLGIMSALLRSSRMLGFTTVSIVLLATLMGGSQATAKSIRGGDIYLGLDFFLLNLIFLGVLFIPIERLLKKVDQPILRYEWREDLLYFLISTLFVQTPYLPDARSVTGRAGGNRLGRRPSEVPSQANRSRFNS